MVRLAFKLIAIALAAQVCLAGPLAARSTMQCIGGATCETMPRKARGCCVHHAAQDTSVGAGPTCEIVSGRPIDLTDVAKARLIALEFAPLPVIFVVLAPEPARYDYPPPSDGVPVRLYFDRSSPTRGPPPVA